MNAYTPRDPLILAILPGFAAAIFLFGLWLQRRPAQAWHLPVEWFIVLASVATMERIASAEPAGVRMLLLIAALLWSMKLVVLTSTRLAGGPALPPISSYDQAALLRALCDELGIGKLHAIVGASYGGMVALAFAERHPARVDRLLVIGAAHRTNPMATAWRCVEREAVRFGIARGDGPGGLRLARALAMATYRTRAEFERRFDGDPQVEDGRMVFPVERYLFARGDEYARRYAPEAFMCLSESIDLRRISPEAVKAPAALVAVTEDQLVTIDDMRELAARIGGPARFYELRSLYGHDAFLKERKLLEPAFAWALDGDTR